MIKVGIETTPLSTGHAVRGIGVYTKNLIDFFREENLSGMLVGELKTGEQYNLIHYPYFDLFFASLPFFKKTRTIVTIHDVTPLLFPDHYPPGIKGRINFIRQKVSLGTVSAVITDSDNSQKDIVKYLNYPKEKIYVVYLAPSEEMKKLTKGDWIKEITQKYHLPEKYILYVGDVNWNKNLLGLARVCKKANFPLVIVGKQAAEENFNRNHIENESRVKLLNEYGKDPGVLRVGFVPEEDLVKIYNLATVYCQPSFYEGFGIPVLEAMACGCPVISSNTSSLKEICGNAAILFDPYDENDFFEKLEKLLISGKMRSDLGENGLVWVKKFTWSKTATETKKVYEKVSKE